MQEVTFESLTANDKKLLIKHYYEEPVDFIDAKNKHKVGRSCKHCKTDKVGDSEFHGNFLTHIRSIDDWKKTLIELKSNRVGPLDKIFHIVSSKAQLYHDWIEWVVMTDRASTFVENPYNRKYAKMDGISRTTYDKYKDRLHIVMENKIRSELPSTFLLYFDGWSCEGEHYLCMFATWTNKSKGVVTRLIACTVQDLPAADENHDQVAMLFGFTAEDLGDEVKRVLQRYDRDFDSLEGLGSDNAEVNKRLAYLITAYLKDELHIDRPIVLLGCASHRLSLAVKWFCSADNNEDYERLIKLLHDLMIALKTSKNRYKLAAKTSLCPEVESDTRWDSIGEMISKGLRLREVLPLCSFDRHTMALIPSPPDWGRLEELHGHLNAFKAVSKWLQTGVTEERDRKEVNFATCRVAFDTLIDMFPAERGKKGVKHWLGPDADIIHDKYFERAIERIHGGDKISDLPANLQRKVAHFKPAPAPAAAPDASRHFLSRALDEVEARYAVDVSFRHFLRVNNICERLFSRCKLLMTDNRKLMDPSTLEVLIMLRTNKDLWDERDMEWILNNPRFFDAIDQDSAENDAEDDEDEVTSISAISYQETRRVRQRTGAHGWQSLSSLSR